MAQRVHFSRSVLAEAASGTRLPSEPVVRAYAQACGADPQPWADRRQRVHDGLELVSGGWMAEASPWPQEPVVDGADPDAAGCVPDAVTVHARRLAMRDRRVLVGLVQLRYSPTRGAGWARFEGLGPLDHIAAGQRVEIVVQTLRQQPQGVTEPSRMDYVFDSHWSDLLCIGTGALKARAEVYIDGLCAAVGETDALNLP